MIWFLLDCIMHFTNHIATNVCSRKCATTFGDLPDCFCFDVVLVCNMLCRIYPYLLRLICCYWSIETTNPKGQINHMNLRLIIIANNKKQRTEECMSKEDYSTFLIAVKEHSLDSRNLSYVYLYHCCLVQVHINPKHFLPQIDPCSWEWLVLLFGISGIPFFSCVTFRVYDWSFSTMILRLISENKCTRYQPK